VRRQPLGGLPEAQLGEIPVVEAGEHGDRQDQRHRGARLPRSLPRGLDGFLHHLPPPEGVEVEHGDPEPDRPLGGLGHRVGDVVELEVEEHPPAEALDAADDLGPEVGEGLLADLVDPDVVAQALDPLQGLANAVPHVEGEDQARSRIPTRSHPRHR